METVKIGGACARCFRIDLDLLVCPTRDELDALANYDPSGGNTSYRETTFQKFARLGPRCQPEDELPLATLRELSASARAGDCPVCVLLWKIVRRHHQPAEPPLTWCGRELVCFVKIKPFASYLVGRDRSESFDIRRLSLHIEVPCQRAGDFTGDSNYDIEFCVQAADPMISMKRWQLDAWIAGASQWVTVVETPPDGGIFHSTPQDGGFGGRFRPAAVDDQMVAQWIKACREQHNCGNMLYGSLDCPGMRVIDLDQRCLLSADSVPCLKYVALSYCWGKDGKKLTLTSDNYASLHKAGALTRDLLPCTIADAMEFLAKLGVRYLWVDALCIRQDDNKDKGQQIGKMHLIYNNASFTLVAASGVQADSGLPGVATGTSESRSKQDSVTVLRRARGICTDISSFATTLVATLAPQKIDFDHYLEPTPWYKRGWTMQERALSNRNLIFDGNQVYWECKEASWCEEAGFDTGGLRLFRRARETTVHLSEQEKNVWIRSRSQGRRDADGDADRSLRGEFLGHYGYLVMRYSQRVFGQEEDVFVGFSGIAAAVRQIHGEETLWGLLQSCFEQDLLWFGWSGPPRPVMASLPSAPGDGLDLVRIPSWSWMAWEGPVQMSHFGIHPQVVCYRMTSSGLKKVCEIHESNFPRIEDNGVLDRRPWIPAISLDCTEDQLKETHLDILVDPDVLLGNVLFFWASTARFSIEWEGDPRKGGMPGLRNRDGTYAGTLMQCNGDWWVKENLNHSEADFVVMSIQDPEKGVKATLQVLQVRWQDGIAYRMNVGMVEEDVWMRANPKWALIALG